MDISPLTTPQEARHKKLMALNVMKAEALRLEIQLLEHELLEDKGEVGGDGMP